MTRISSITSLATASAPAPFPPREEYLVFGEAASGAARGAVVG
jgi:hypothetical protein